MEPFRSTESQPTTTRLPLCKQSKSTRQKCLRLPTNRRLLLLKTPFSPLNIQVRLWIECWACSILCCRLMLTLYPHASPLSLAHTVISCRWTSSCGIVSIPFTRILTNQNIHTKISDFLTRLTRILWEAAQHLKAQQGKNTRSSPFNLLNSHWNLSKTAWRTRLAMKCGWRKRIWLVCPKLP